MIKSRRVVSFTKRVSGIAYISTDLYCHDVQRINFVSRPVTMPSPLDQPEQPTPAELNGGEVQAQADVDQPPQPLAIEFGEATQIPDDNPPADEPVQKLDVGQGDAVKLDALGPMIINTDGVSPSVWTCHVLLNYHRHYLEYRIGTSFPNSNGNAQSVSWSRRETWSDFRS